MRRDVDLERQLLLEVEARGAECPVSALAGDAAEPTQERVRHHVRLLLDAGLLKDVDRKTASTVRLTSAGHELIELARSDARWHEAKYFVRDTTGGLSLTVLRTMLTKWAVESAARAERRPRRRVYRPVVTYDRAPRSYGYYYDRDSVLSDPPPAGNGFVRTWPDYRERADRFERFEWRDADERDEYYRYAEPYEPPRKADAPSVGVSLPIYMV